MVHGLHLYGDGKNVSIGLLKVEGKTSWSLLNTEDWWQQDDWDGLCAIGSTM